MAAEFADIARLLMAEVDVETTLSRVCALAVEHIAGCDHAGISLVEGRQRIVTHGATDGVSTEVDRLQYATGQGPCLDAIRDHAVLISPDLSLDTRWPDFARAAVAATGVRSMMSFRLFAARDTMGALNLYSRRPAAFVAAGPAAEVGSVFAAHAAVALSGARAVANLKVALESRETISVAVGVLMCRQGVGRQAGFDILRRASQRENVKVRDLAARIIGGADVPGYERPAG